MSTRPNNGMTDDNEKKSFQWPANSECLCFTQKLFTLTEQGLMLCPLGHSLVPPIKDNYC
jgi:hypothetical protein